MCGIAGEYALSGAPPGGEVLRHMTRTLTHRGPDEEGFFEHGPVAMGMRRLSIVGVETGSQPLKTPCGSVALVFNGEIYNYPQLKKRLQDDGFVFATGSDGEAMLYLYQQHGLDFVNHLNGIFAVALYDLKNRRLVLARDHLGVKPLFVYEDRQRVLFGSEIKALLAHPACPRQPSPQSLVNYLRFSYAPLRDTVYKDLHRLLPGEMLVLEPDKPPARRVWWRLPDKVDEASSPKSHNEAVEDLRQRLQDAVKRQLLSDVPVGAFLSGGIDSAAVVALMRPHVDQLSTFSLGFEGDLGDVDERQRAALTARHLQTDHHDICLGPGQIAEHFDEALGFFDEPFGGGLHTFFLSREAAKTHKVVLTGIGADELLGGYNRNRRLGHLTAWASLPGVFKNTAAATAGLISAATGQRTDRWRRISRLLTSAPGEHYFAWISLFDQGELQRLLGREFAALAASPPLAALTAQAFGGEEPGEITRRTAWLELRTTLAEDFLAYTDRTTMAHGLEARVPFLDHTLVASIHTWPDQIRFTPRPKQVLYDAVKDLLPPALQERKKQPFLLPVDRWLRGPLKPFVQETLLGDLASAPLLDPAGVRQLVLGYFAGQERAWQVWHLLGLERFFRLQQGGMF